MSDLVSKAIPLTQISLAEGSISSSYALVGTFTSPIIKMVITSTLNAAVILSFDGVNDNLTIPMGSTTNTVVVLDFKSNKLIMSATSVYVKQVASVSTGSIYVSAFSAITP